MRLTIDIPSPVPDGLVVKNGRKMRSRCSGAMPTPVSLTTTTARPSRTIRSTSTRPPPAAASMDSTAFLMTLAKTWRSFWPSPRTIAPGSTAP